MKSRVDSNCDCDCDCARSGRGVSAKRAMFAGCLGGIVGVALVAILAAMLFRRMGPRLMKRMMRDREFSPEMRACMEKCGCAPPAEDRPSS